MEWNYLNLHYYNLDLNDFESFVKINFQRYSINISDR